MLISIVTAIVAAAGSACDRTPSARATTVVDSVVPREEALRRFRAALPEVESLSGGASSRDALVRGFVRALETRDTVALRRMLMSRAEYAWIYYPTNPQGLPPYDLSPSLYWFMIEGRSSQGLTHALAERAGHPLHVVGYSCDAGFSQEGANRVYGPCLVQRRQGPGDVVAERLFGPILERGGRFKFVSYANKL
jgi:hypothetical protein